jgi:hypothetical protein
MENEKKDSSKWAAMVMMGILFGGIPGAFAVQTDSYILSFIIGSLIGIIFWVGLGLILDKS